MKKSKTNSKPQKALKTKTEKAIATMRKAISQFTDDYMSERIQPAMQKRSKIS